ncbi:MAG: hypothetical protein RIB84_09110 [Sneathiellaceae bacterium]
MNLDDAFALYDARGQESYGEAITQLAHALQSGLQAEQAGAPPALVTAAVLHDIGHLLHRDSRAAHDNAVDDRHELIAGKALAALFGSEVVGPVRLHVQAKRYLCHAEPGYRQALSETSQISLRLQGGPMAADEAALFRRSPHFDAALHLRRWDDAAKVPGLATPDLSHYRAIAAGCLAPQV